MDMIRRGYVLTKSLGEGHADLNLAISEEKAVVHEIQNLTKARSAAAAALVKWSQKEENPALRDVFQRLSELDVAWSFIQKEFGERYESYRKCFKAVREHEKVLDRSRKHRDSCANKLQKLQRDLEKYNRKGDYGKASQVESEIIVAEGQNDMAEADFQEKYRENEILKVAHIKEGVSNIGSAYLEMAEKCILVFSAAKELSELIPEEPVHLTDAPIYDGGEDVGIQIVQSAQKALAEFAPQYQTPSYDDGQQFDDE